MVDEYEEDDDSYIYRSIFISTHSKCPVCGTIGYYNGICIVCDIYNEDEATNFE